MTDFLGKNALYWYNQYINEAGISNERGLKIRNLERKVDDLEVRLGIQRRTIRDLMEEKAAEAQNGASDAPVVNEGALTLEERVNNLEKTVATYGKVFDTVDATLNVLIDRLNKLEEPAPVEYKVDLITKGAAMLDLADAINRSIDKMAGRKFK